MRVRFAPSPTGDLHIGGARTALFNWLQARHDGGGYLLRIEDTDRERSTPETVDQILDALGWLGLDWDEGPLLQTTREERHREVVGQLLDSGAAYRTTAARPEIDAWKAEHGKHLGFRGTPEESGAVRLRWPEGETVVHDLIRGEVTFRNELQDDLVIARGDGSPVYNFAVAIDDLDSGVTHVIRGDDHLSNTPKQLLVLQALGAEPPVYAHIPLIYGPDGKKLSKRHGAVGVQEYRALGYLPEALRNYLALLGWGSDDDATKMSTDELVRRFGIERVQRNPAQFDEKKLRWLNGLYIRELTVDELTARLEAFTGRDGLRAAAEISQEKIQTLADFWPLAGFLFDGPAEGDEKARAKWLGEEGLPRGADGRPGAVRRRVGAGGARRGRRFSRGQAEGRLPADPRRARGHHDLTRDLRDGGRSGPRGDAGARRQGACSLNFGVDLAFWLLSTQLCVQWCR